METDTKVQESPKDNVLTSLIKSSNLDKAKSDVIMASFGEILNIADEWKQKADALVITDPSQTDLMEEARKGRLFLKDKRVTLEKKHKELKEESLREGQALDAIKRTLLDLIRPIEETLQLKEDFAKIFEENRKGKLKDDRLKLLGAYDIHQEVGYDLGGMPNDVWKAFYSGVKTNWENKKEQERKDAEEKLRLEEIENLNIERIRLLQPYSNYLSKEEDELNLGELSKKDFTKLFDGIKSAKEEDDRIQAEKKIVQERHVARKDSILELWQFLPDNIKGENFGELGEIQWDALVDVLKIEKTNFDQKQEEIKFENDRLQKEANERKELERERNETQSVRLNELLPYSAFGPETDMTILWSFTVPAYSAILKKKKDAFEADKNLKDEQSAKAKEAQDALDLKNKQENDEKLAKEEEDRLASLASEKDKFIRFASHIQVMEIPQMDTTEGKQVMSDVAAKRDSFVRWASEQASRL